MPNTDLHSALKHHFGFDSFRPGQEAVLRAALDGRDLLAIMPTGGGKSLCFQLPALLTQGVMVVVSPLIALMQDQVRQLEDNGISATFLNSSLSAAQGSERMAALLRGEIKLLYLAPERLLMSGFLDGFLKQLHETRGLSAFTIDEAHCVSEWGHDFRPEYRQMRRLREEFPQVPMLAFTATATARVRQDIASQLELRDPVIQISSFNRPNLFYAVRDKSARSYDELLEHARGGGSGIVYCLSRKRVDEIAQRLHQDGVAALPYHAGLDAHTRRDNQERYIRDDAQVMVATIAFGMGINKPDVRWVIHFDLPKTIEGYYQEAGRSGRDGEPARCILYFGVGDIRTAEFLIAQKIHPDTGEPLEEEQRLARQQLRQVIDYAQASSCRRAIQLRYFGEASSGNCGACDNCLSPRPSEDWSLEARQFLSCVARLAQRGQRFGAAYIIELLRGSKNEKILRNGHETLSVYGIGQQRSMNEWRLLARTLLHQELIEETHDGFPVLRLNPASLQVLREGRAVQVTVAPPKELVSRKKTKAIPMALVTRSAQGLFEQLRELRKSLASAQGVPPYIVFSDASLRMMAQRKPRTLHEFADISGVGDRKLDLYGEEFTALIRNFAQTP